MRLIYKMDSSINIKYAVVKFKNVSLKIEILNGQF